MFSATCDWFCTDGSHLIIYVVYLFKTHPEALTETMQYVRFVSYECQANCHLYCMQAACDRTRVSFDFIILENIIANVHREKLSRVGLR